MHANDVNYNFHCANMSEDSAKGQTQEVKNIECVTTRN